MFVLLFASAKIKSLLRNAIADFRFLGMLRQPEHKLRLHWLTEAEKPHDYYRLAR